MWYRWNPLNDPIFFPPQNVSKNHFHKTGKFKKKPSRENRSIKKKDELMANIRHSLDVLIPWQRPMPKKQKLKNKGYYVGNLTGKSQDNCCKTTELVFLLYLLLVHIVTFVETLGSHLKLKIELFWKLYIPDTGWQSSECRVCSVAGRLLKNSVTRSGPPFTKFPFQTIVVSAEYNFAMSCKRNNQTGMRLELNWKNSAKTQILH